MTDRVLAAECDCDTFAVNTAGTDWGKGQLVSLVRTHLQNCRAPPDEIEIVERDEDGNDVDVVETVTTPGSRGLEGVADAGE